MSQASRAKPQSWRHFIIALGASVAAVAALGTTAQAAIDPDLPLRPEDIGDMFLVEYDGDWFCPNSVSDANKICPGEPPDPRTTGNTSQQAVTALVVHMYLQLVGHPSAKPGRPQLLRVGKARNDCIHGAAGCDTGVPPPTACPQFNSSPYCALTALKAYDVGLGVIMGSGQPGPPEEDGRPIRDMAWHACAVRRADRSGDGGRGLYDFMFLDEAKYLRGTVAEVVQRITAGRILDSNGDWVRCKDGANPFVGDPLDGWDVITNDNGWNLPKYSGYTLNTAAWGHATKYDRAFESEQQLRDVADGQAPLLTPGDFDFINRVNAVDTSSGQTFATRAIFRVEVPGYTSKLGTWLTPAQQCRFLERAARRQFQDGDTRHSFIYPLYVHGGPFGEEASYDSIDRGTFFLQMQGMHRYQSPNNDQGLTQACPSTS